MQESAVTHRAVEIQDISAQDNSDNVSNLEFGDSDDDELMSMTSRGTGGKLKQQAINVEKTTKRIRLLAFLVVLMGAAAGGSFLYLGITNLHKENEDQFERHASDLANEITITWRDYETAALWIHQSCMDWRTEGTHCSREGFERLSHYLRAGGLEFEGALWVPNVTHVERIQLEANSTWNTTKRVNYTGFKGQEPNPDNGGKLAYGPRSEQPFYFPLHFIEPSDNETSVADYDVYSAPWEMPAIQKAIDTWEPAMTGAFQLVSDSESLIGKSVAFYHPGVRLPEKFGVEGPRDLSSMVIHIKSLLTRATRFQSESMAAYMFDKTGSGDDAFEQPSFLAALKTVVSPNNRDDRTTDLLPAAPYRSLKGSSQYYEEDIRVGGRTWVMVFVPVEGTFEPELKYIGVSGVMIFLASVLLAMWMLHNMNNQIKMHRIICESAAEAAIVAEMFPPNVRDRMLEDVGARNQGLATAQRKDVFTRSGSGNYKISQRKLKSALTSEGIFGSKPIADLHPYTTIMFADFKGFSAWASVREPFQVFSFLEIVYHSWDMIAKRRGVFKVETVRDSYTAIAGLPEARDDHAVVMAKFASDCAYRVRKLCHALEKTLGPDTGDLAVRIGLHSGQAIGGVLRGDKGRFQLFGDTVHKAGQIEATCVPNKIHMSQETAELLIEAGHGKWCIPNNSSVTMKGGSNIQTFFLHIQSRSNYSSNGDDFYQDFGFELGDAMDSSQKTARLVSWNVEVLSGLLRSIVAQRSALSGSQRSIEGARQSIAKRKSMVLDEVVEVISFPRFEASASRKHVDRDTVTLDAVVIEQLTILIQTIESMYRDNHFHNFEHASHVVMSVTKMMGRIVDPKGLAKRSTISSISEHQIEAERHDHTFGINSDPLTQFACVFSALIHDLDHYGVPNIVLVKEEDPLAVKYKKKSVLEQHSVDLVWDLLMQEKFDSLRSCICSSQTEFARFRALVVNSVMATDIMDKELSAARKHRWNKAFNAGDDWMGQQEGPHVKTNRKATIVIEHLLQASDISHTMQHWHVYAKWNECLFHEMNKAFKEDRLQDDPATTWYAGELAFFDHCIIPLGKKLKTCGVFGVSSDEYLNNAIINRKEWAAKGEAMVEQYQANAEKRHESKDTAEDLLVGHTTP